MFSRDGIAQGDGGRTSLKMTDTLATGRTYYWRVRAQDGANTGPYATPASFAIFTPIVIDVPGLDRAGAERDRAQPASDLHAHQRAAVGTGRRDRRI